MNENIEFESYPELQSSIIPDFSQIVSKKINTSKQSTSKEFDPYKLMIQKKELNSDETINNTSSIQIWPEKDIKALEDFCHRHSIIGFNCGRMHPIAALAMLKKQFNFTDEKLEENIPYQKKVLFG